MFIKLLTDFLLTTTVPGVVTDLQASSPNETTLVISWRPPADPNGDILSFSVSIINIGDNSIVVQEMVNVQRYLKADLGKNQ